MEVNYLSWDWLVPEWHLHAHISQAAFQLWDQPEVDLLACSHEQINVNAITPWKVLSFWGPCT